MHIFKRFLVILIWLLASLACVVSGTVTNPTRQLPTPTTEEIPSVVPGDLIPDAVMKDPEVFLAETLQDRLLSTPVRAIMQEVRGNSKVKFMVEFQPPDRLHMLVPGVLEGTLVDQDIDINVNKAWRGLAVKDDFLYAFCLLRPGGEYALENIKDVQFANAEFLDKKPTLVFTFSADIKVAGIDSTSTNRLWLGALDGRIYKIVSTGISGKIRSTMTAELEYDPDLTIQPLD